MNTTHFRILYPSNPSNYAPNQNVYNDVKKKRSVLSFKSQGEIIISCNLKAIFLLNLCLITICHDSSVLMAYSNELFLPYTKIKAPQLLGGQHAQLPPVYTFISGHCVSTHEKWSWFGNLNQLLHSPKWTSDKAAMHKNIPKLAHHCTANRNIQDQQAM